MTTVPNAPKAKAPTVNATPSARPLYLILAVIAVVWVMLPMYLVAANAFSTRTGVSAYPKPAFPQPFSLDTLRFFFSVDGVWPAFWTSMLVAVLTMLFSVVLGAPAGYALARFQFRGSTLYRFAILLTRAFPLAILAIPLAVRFIQLGLYDTALGVALVHTALALPFAVLVTSGLFVGIPVELEEAAWTLNCTKIQAFFKVVLPLVLPGLAATAIFAFTISWNEVFAATILTLRHRTLPALLLTSLNEAPLYFRFAGGFIMIIPAVVFIFAVRKYLFTLWGISSR